MTPGIYDALILAGIIQGLLFGSTILTSRKYRTRSRIYLALLILCFSLENLQFSLDEMNFISESMLYNVIYVPWATLVPPFLLFYGMTFLNPETVITKKLKLLYLPFISMFTLSSFYKMLMVFDTRQKEFDAFLDMIPYYGDTYGDLLNMLFFILIIVVLFIKILDYEKENAIFKKDKIKLQLRWFKLTLLVLSVLMVMWLVFTIGYAFDNELVFYPLYLAASLTIYWLGYIGIYKIGVNEQQQKIREFANQRPFVEQEEPQKMSDHLMEFKRMLVEDRLFLDSNLSLEAIADILEISKGHLSRTINSELGMGFNDYVNSFRVDEAKTYLLHPDFSNYTLEAIGLEAGFNSKSTFYSTFKKITGLTPLQFKNSSVN
ncbi:MAG: helix-turn-helix transcriptional regulator [Gelidibacter sp.]